MLLRLAVGVRLVVVLVVGVRLLRWVVVVLLVLLLLVLLLLVLVVVVLLVELLQLLLQPLLYPPHFLLPLRPVLLPNLGLAPLLLLRQAAERGRRVWLWVRA
jgi:hypothetical protein